MVVENSELADQVLVGQVWVRISVLTSISPVLVVKSGEKSGLHLVSYVVTSKEASKSDWDLHPSFSEQWVVGRGSMLEWLSFIGYKRSYSRVEHNLLALHVVVFVDLLGVIAVVSKLSLEFFDISLSFF